MPFIAAAKRGLTASPFYAMMTVKQVSNMEPVEKSKRYEQHLQRIRKLRLMDDDFMTKCFEDSPECTELLLHIILDKPDLRVEEVRTQYGLKNLQGRSVRLDIFAVDQTGKRYNIEVQRASQGAGARRARYHSSLMDANLLLAGDDTENLPEVYVIFITERDVLGKGKALYHISRTIEETGDLFGDGSHILYVNGANRDETPLGKLMHDFSCADPASMTYEVLANRVRYFKDDKEGVHTMCQILEEMCDEAAREAAKETAKNTLLSNVKALMETMHLTAEQAMDALRVPAEERAGLNVG